MHDDLSELWREWWAGDIWITPWSKALDGLTPEQAAWTPEGGRHSIWQLVNHVMFWRDVTMQRIAGNPPAGYEPEHDEQFPAPSRVDAPSWDATRARLESSHEAIRAAIDDEKTPRDRLRYHLAHDAYHLGQIMQLRALQGLPPVL